MNNKYSNLSKLDRKRDTITIGEFVNQYLCDVGMIDCRKLKHKDLRILGENNPYILSLSFDYVNSNPELVADGTILMVIDKSGNPAPYLNPKKIIKLLDKTQINEEIGQLKKETFNDLKLLSMKYFKMCLLLLRKKEVDEVSTILKDNGKSYIIRRIEIISNRRSSKDEL